MATDYSYIGDMNQIELPDRAEMIKAFQSRDASYDGVFITAVRTTGIFCRPTCPARKPLVENILFYATTRDALFAGFTPCKRCRPLELTSSVPEWLRPLLTEVDREPSRRWRDRDLRILGLSPDRVRRWFKSNHDITFHAYSRARRLGSALGMIQKGSDVINAAYDHGYESMSGFNEAFLRRHGRSPGKMESMNTVIINRLPTPLGPMIACATDDALCLLEFADRRMVEGQMKQVEHRLNCVLVPGDNKILDQLAVELDAYFAGDLTEFTIGLNVPGTPFQEEVWKELQQIPYGTTLSYGELAKKLGRPTAFRAVANANGDNRVAIIIPCHRVIGSDGKLTGYGGGLWRKQRLLDLEMKQLSLGF